MLLILIVIPLSLVVLPARETLAARGGYQIPGMVEAPQPGIIEAIRQKSLVEGKEMLLLEFSMTPLDKGESVSKYVSRSLDIIDKSGLEYRINPMGTVLEGEWDDVMNVVRECYKTMSADCDRISVAIKIDARKGRSGRLTSKIDSVEKKLGRSLKK